MVTSRTARRYLLSRGVIVLFGVQLVLLLATFAQPLHGVRAVTIPVIVEAQFVNGLTDLLFAPEYAGPWDPLATLLVLPLVYYATAVVASGFGRAVSQSVQRRFGR